MSQHLSHIEALAQLAASGQPFVVITMVESRGSTPQESGAKMLVTPTGRIHGSVGGGKLEHRAIIHARDLLAGSTNHRQLVEWNLQRDIGMTCGGIVKLFFESYNHADWHIVVFGAGHVAQSLIQILSMLDCRITCIDSRTEWLDRLSDNARVTCVCVDDLAAETETLRPEDFVVCMTMGHATDRPILESIFRKQIQPVFLGVIGSRAKRGALLRELQSAGIAAERARQFLCPIGLPIGSNQPAEIAISIAAQLLEFRDRTCD